MSRVSEVFPGTRGVRLIGQESVRRPLTRPDTSRRPPSARALPHPFVPRAHQAPKTARAEPAPTTTAAHPAAKETS
ncbi:MULTISPECIES: hypothetical protein [unclassified Streptomyces]|uniref:Uncharacterized protein n=1 Tax=Streptomyces sp. NBC_01393 TaxID=2903851 RepID=A0AAU3HWN9_9ACTN|nr:hypothetical protein [Streptomyces sp. NBC_00151]WRZ42569.1 hypothetical protein OG915_33740 [Streptomyces sp. NBC_00151]